MNLNAVVSAISDKGLRLYRTAEDLQVEGDCPPELAAAIKEHRASLLPFAAAAPEVKAAEASNHIRQQVEAFAVATVRSYLPRVVDEQLAKAVDTQDPAIVAKEIARLKEHFEVIDWASELFPLTMETEAKHAAESGAAAAGELSPDDDIPF